MKRAEARETGASLASRQRDLDFAGCSMVKMSLVGTGCGYDLVSKREVAPTKRFANKAEHTITAHTANGPTVTESVTLRRGRAVGFGRRARRPSIAGYKELFAGRG